MSRVLFAGLSICMFWAGSAFAEHHIGTFSDSGIEGPTYAQHVQNFINLETQRPQLVELIMYGEAVSGLPLYAIKLRNKRLTVNTDSPRRAVLITGVTHGNEYLNIEDRLPGFFVGAEGNSVGFDNYLAAGGIVYVVPIVNPDGYTADIRTNSNGVDLNRDFDLIPEQDLKFSQPETRALADFLEAEIQMENLQLQLTVDYHCCDGSLLYPWSYTRDSLPDESLEAHRQIARFMQERIDASYEHGSTGQVLGYYPRGTSKDYYFAKYDALSFTFEGKYRVENANFAKHTLWWDDIFRYLVNRRMPEFATRKPTVVKAKVSVTAD